MNPSDWIEGLWCFMWIYSSLLVYENIFLPVLIIQQLGLLKVMIWRKMAEVKDECCLENKQSAAGSTSSVSENSESVTIKSPGIGSPTPTSPSHRYYVFSILSWIIMIPSLEGCEIH